MDNVTLNGKTVIVTGCNTGIGKETALELAKRGAKVIMACRSEERTEPTRQEIISETSNDKVKFMKLDLGSLASVRAFAEAFNNSEDRLDILVNNAGVLTRTRQETEDGHEMMFGVNHLGHFLLTNLLLDKLKASKPSRIVSVSSMAHEKYPIKLDDLESEKKFTTMEAYGQSKTANILFVVHLEQLLKDTGVTTYALHPGVINTELGRDIPMLQNCCFQCILRCAVRCFLCSKVVLPDEGAQTTLYCCLEPSIAEHSGRYYSDSKEKAAKSHATNPETARQLWEASLEKVGPI